LMSKIFKGAPKGQVNPSDLAKFLLQFLQNIQ
ncbi:unnamed protein product, partial [marine sediment metagenome]